MKKIFDINKKISLLIKENIFYKEVEFVCYNSDSYSPEYEVRQNNLFKELKKIDDLFAYRQDFSEFEHKEISLAVIILDKENEENLIGKINNLSKKYNIEIDLINDLDNNQVDDRIKGNMEGIEI